MDTEGRLYYLIHYHLGSIFSTKCNNISLILVSVVFFSLPKWLRSSNVQSVLSRIIVTTLLYICFVS